MPVDKRGIRKRTVDEIKKIIELKICSSCGGDMRSQWIPGGVLKQYQPDADENKRYQFLRCELCGMSVQVTE